MLKENKTQPAGGEVKGKKVWTTAEMVGGKPLLVFWTTTANLKALLLSGLSRSTLASNEWVAEDGWKYITTFLGL
jgi:hypothetical protein